MNWWTLAALLIGFVIGYLLKCWQEYRFWNH